MLPRNEDRRREKQEGDIRLKALSMCDLLHVTFILQAILENTANIE